MALLYLRLLAGFTATDASGAPIALPTRKTEALVALLALRRGAPVRRTELIGLLWPDRGDEQARSSLRQALAAVRRALGEADTLLVADRDTVALRADAVDADVVHFENLVAAGGAEDLELAMERYQGAFLDGMEISDASFAIWRKGESDRLRRLAIAALTTLATDRRRAGRMDEAAALLDQLNALDQQADPGSRAAASVTPVAEPDEPSIAVLPFVGIGPSGATSDYFADGLVEELVTALARFPRIVVIAADSSLRLRGGDAEPARAASALGVRYVLIGSIRRDANGVRIAARLMEAASGRTIWAERFDGRLAELFALQDRLTEAIVAAIEPRIELAEIERVRRMRADMLDAWDFTMRARPLIYAMTRDGMAEAQRLLDAALAIDRNYAPALGLMAWCHTLAIPQRWLDDAVDLRDAVALARRAVVLAWDDPEALAMAGYCVAFLDRDLEPGLSAAERAIALNPGSARVSGFAGWIQAYAGHHERAIALFRRALRLSPFDPLAFRNRAGLAFALLFDGRAHDAVEEARAAVRQQPDYSIGHRSLVAALAQLGRMQEAVAAARDLAAAAPGLTITYAIAETRFIRSVDRELLARNWRAAGLPE